MGRDAGVTVNLKAGKLKTEWSLLQCRRDTVLPVPAAADS